MKYRFGFSLAFILLFSSLVQAQTYMPGGGNYPPYAPPSYQSYPTNYSVSSTIDEGYARGIGEVIRAQGEYNLATSAAAVNFSEARRREIENDKQWVQTYFEMREINRQQRESEIKRRRGNPEDWVRYAQAGRPKLLTNAQLDAVTGKILWPVLLTADNYRAQRAELEKVFVDRAYHGALNAAGLLKVNQMADDMLASLRSQIRELPADQYIEAKRFLESLAYEASQPAG